MKKSCKAGVEGSGADRTGGQRACVFKYPHRNGKRAPRKGGQKRLSDWPREADLEEHISEGERNGDRKEKMR